jgi:starch synthase
VHHDGAIALVRCFERQRTSDQEPRLFLIESPGFDRDGLYGERGADYPDNALRFGTFAAATLEMLRHMDLGNVTLHVHDWHAGLVPVYMHVGKFGHEPFKRLPVVLSVHNGGYQGLFGHDQLTRLGLPEQLWSTDWMEWYGRLNLLKGALKFADMVTTVSPTHAEEIRSEVGGFGLHDVFQSLGKRLVGIRNGIDAERWNPRRDPDIPKRYSVTDTRGKAQCKAALQAQFGLAVRDDVPLFAMSARLAQQKGVELILRSRCVRNSSAQFVLVGDGDPGYALALRELANDRADRVAVSHFNDKLEHQVLAGADFLLMPSLYEPCGLTQMRAQRYGTLPVVRRVGGLADTVGEDVGFLFDDFDPDAFDAALARAIEVFYDHETLARRVRDAMRCDFSWAGPVSAYLRAYQGAQAANNAA